MIFVHVDLAIRMDNAPHVFDQMAFVLSAQVIVDECRERVVGRWPLMELRSMRYQGLRLRRGQTEKFAQTLLGHIQVFFLYIMIDARGLIEQNRDSLLNLLLFTRQSLFVRFYARQRMQRGEKRVKKSFQAIGHERFAKKWQWMSPADYIRWRHSLANGIP